MLGKVFSTLNPYKWLIGAVGVATLLAAIFIGINLYKTKNQNIGYNKAVAEYNVKLLEAEQKARATEQRLNKQIEDARHESEKRKEKLNKLSRDNTDLVKRLRNTIADSKRSLSGNSPETNRETASTALDLFGECTERYSKMAEAADRHAEEVRLLEDSWPK